MGSTEKGQPEVVTPKEPGSWGILEYFCAIFPTKKIVKCLRWLLGFLPVLQ